MCYSTFYLYPSSVIVAQVLGNGYWYSVAWLLGDAKIMIFCLHVAATATATAKAKVIAAGIIY
jgi:hypothetical protein